MQKFKIFHPAKFRNKDNFILQVLFPIRSLLRSIFASGVARAPFDRNLIRSADAWFLVMACVSYVHGLGTSTARKA